MLGDGATNQGAFHEALNLAALFRLPIVSIIENNQFSFCTAVDSHSRYRQCLAPRAEAYDMAWNVIEDGSDLLLLREQLAPVLQRARLRQGPTLVEIATYRFYGFTLGDANSKKYRTPEEIQWHRDHRDPVFRWEKKLLEEDLLPPRGRQQNPEDLSPTGHGRRNRICRNESSPHSG
ncbi:hypothetical protein JIN78_11120 [Roseibacillus ishigakijimensis]|uniref:Dehydrogenase E1 component domain-containing protein n=1 Tax=Roseibacillus ishigakijimensis TaxID=454146 RepID=A0A934RRK0_9BACT|nr:hypothetical protein [Roseibacillus ishigakijimensis]